MDPIRSYPPQCLISYRRKGKDEQQSRAKDSEESYGSLGIGPCRLHYCPSNLLALLRFHYRYHSLFFFFFFFFFRLSSLFLRLLFPAPSCPFRRRIEHQHFICRDPEVSQEMEELLSEEVKLKEAEAARNQQRADVALLEAKKMASQYQKEADKCSAGMDTCEVAREKADEALLSQRRISSIWELRARQRGWRPSAADSTAIGDLLYTQ
ncbi:hypothetical protein LINGRAHAP2_LOCUS27416 [Linum grandiflorum]